MNEPTTTTTPLPPTSTTSTTPPLIGVLGEPITGTLMATGVKPGRMTSEFIVTMLIIAIGSTLASGVIVNNTAIQLAGVAMTVLKAIAYTWSRTVVKTAAMLMLALFAFHSTGCGASARQKTLTSTLAGLDSAEIGLVTFDKDYQDKIVTDCRDDSACNEAIGHQRLVEYRAKRDQIVMAIKVAYNMLGQAYKLDDDASMANVVAAAAVIATQLSALGVK